MAVNYTLKVKPEQAKEMAMVDLAFHILKSANTSFYYRDLMEEVAKHKGISPEDIKDVIAQLYTEINIDGRFACIGNNTWGLKRWYPLDKMDDSVGTPDRPRIINDDDDDDEELDDLEEELEDDFDADLDDNDEIEDDEALDEDEDIDDEELDEDEEIEDDEEFSDDEDEDLDDR